MADIVSSLGTLLPDVDRAVLTDEHGEDMAAGLHEALRTGIDGWLDDDVAHITPWGFGVEEISIPVMLWQGSADRMVHFAHGQWLASRLPGLPLTSSREKGICPSVWAPSTRCSTSWWRPAL